MASSGFGSGAAWADAVLAGLDSTDRSSGTHPYLHLAAVGQQQSRRVNQALTRRARTANFTPGGLPQPPEVMGVDADARVPNRLQPMSGEFQNGHEIDDGRPAFFGWLFAPPTGVASNPRQQEPDLSGLDRRTFGAPTAMPEAQRISAPPVGADRFAWRPPVAASYAALARQVPGAVGGDIRATRGGGGGGSVDAGYAQGLPGGASIDQGAVQGLPRFADGGTLPAGGAGIVGENGPELLTAAPGGGAKVTPLARTPLLSHDLGGAVDLSGLGSLASLPSMAGGATPPAAPGAGTGRGASASAAMAPTGNQIPSQEDLSGLNQLTAGQQRSLGGYPTTAPPPDVNTAENAYNQAARQVTAAMPPQRNDPAFKTPVWRRALGVGLGAFAGGFARNPNFGYATYLAAVPDKYEQAEQDYETQQRAQLAGLEPLLESARLEQADNQQQARNWQTDTEQQYRLQEADDAAALREQAQDEQDQLRQQQLEQQSWYQNQLAQARQETATRPLTTTFSAGGQRFSYAPNTNTATPVTVVAPNKAPELVTMRAPNGQTERVRPDQVQHYQSLGATVVN